MTLSLRVDDKMGADFAHLT